MSRGNVELCGYNYFSAICGNVWSSNDAKVVCRQLGFNGSMFVFIHEKKKISFWGVWIECVLLNKVGNSNVLKG